MARKTKSPDAKQSVKIETLITPALHLRLLRLQAELQHKTLSRTVRLLLEAALPPTP